MIAEYPRHINPEIPRDLLEIGYARGPGVAPRPAELGHVNGWAYMGMAIIHLTQRGPSVYETEGPRGLAARTADCAATLRRGATTSARNPPEAPAARLSPRSGISPGWSPFTVAHRRCRRPAQSTGHPVLLAFRGLPRAVPFPTVKAFLLPHGSGHKGYPPVISRFFVRPHEVHRRRAVIPRRAVLFHRAIHNPVHKNASPARAASLVADVRDHCGEGLQRPVRRYRDRAAMLSGAKRDPPGE